MHVNHIGLRVEMVLPDIFEKHRARHDLARVTHQILQQFEFPSLQLDRLPTARHPMRQKVDAQVCNSEDRLDFDTL